MRRIFQGKLPCQPAFASIEPVERGLQAGQFRTCCGEAFGRNAQLLRVRPVLGVMNGDDLAGTEAQGIVEGAWLGPRPAFGDEHDAVFVIKAERLSCGDCLLVIGLERQPATVRSSRPSPIISALRREMERPVRALNPGVRRARPSAASFAHRRARMSGVAVWCGSPSPAAFDTAGRKPERPVWPSSMTSPIEVAFWSLPYKAQLLRESIALFPGVSPTG